MTIPTRVSAGVFAVSFLMSVGQPAPLRAGDIVVDDPGRTEKALAIRCGGHDGTISISSGVRVTETANPTNAGDRPDVRITVGYSNGISVAYNGTRCAECKWLVFAWRELFATYKGQGEVRQAGLATTPNGSYELTENPATPNYHVDSASSLDPYYEAGGNTNLRTPTSTTIFDQPSPRPSVAGRRAPPAARGEAASISSPSRRRPVPSARARGRLSPASMPATPCRDNGRARCRRRSPRLQPAR